MKTEINGIEMGFDSLNQTGVPIVLIHGFGLNRTIWHGMASKYLGNHRVILPDVRGHGESEAPESIYLMSTLASDIIHLLDFLKINKAIICGHSMGGYITLALAEKFPERMSGIGLITTHAQADSDEKRAARYEMVEKVHVEGSKALADSLAPKLTQDEEIKQTVHQMLTQAPPQGIIGALKGMAERPDRTTLLNEIQVPALVAAGEEDQLIDITTAGRMAETLSQGDFLKVPDAGHMPMLENPDVLGQGLLSLIHRVETGDD